jgi:hypothetical protein
MAMGLSVATGITTYLIAFELALRFDQPFGPVLVLCLVPVATLSAVTLWAWGR